MNVNRGAMLGLVFLVVSISVAVWAAGAGDKKPVPTRAQFQTLMDRTCVKCHQHVTTTVADQKKAKWIVPGNPEASPTYTKIGKHKKSTPENNLKDDEKQLIYDYIKAGAPEN